MQDALINLSGNVGNDVEYSQGDGWSLARFRLACTPRRIRQGVWVDQETTWIQVNAWGRMADNMAASLAKGDPVLVVGRLRTSAWSGSDGVRHERLVVEATGVGHDLSRGRSQFTRNERRAILDPTGGGRIDAVTGELLDEEPEAGGQASEQVAEQPSVEGPVGAVATS